MTTWRAPDWAACHGSKRFLTFSLPWPSPIRTRPRGRLSFKPNAAQGDPRAPASSTQDRFVVGAGARTRFVQGRVVRIHRGLNGLCRCLHPATRGFDSLPAHAFDVEAVAAADFLHPLVKNVSGGMAPYPVVASTTVWFEPIPETICSNGVHIDRFVAHGDTMTPDPAGHLHRAWSGDQTIPAVLEKPAKRPPRVRRLNHTRRVRPRFQQLHCGTP